MAYKKYITRNGKVYGPYVYHSRRVNGKVVSEYRGSTEKKKSIDYKKFIWVFLGIFILGVIAYGFSITDNRLTGNAVLNLNANYQEGEFVNGNLKVLLKEGELIPSNSQVIFETSEGIFEYNLKDIISNNINQGDYYIKGKNIIGQGEGYGLVGEKKVYPEVNFLLRIISSEVSEEVQNNEDVNEEEIIGDIIEEEIVEEFVSESFEEQGEEFIEISNEVIHEFLEEQEIVDEVEEEIIGEIVEEESMGEGEQEIVDEVEESAGEGSLAEAVIFDFFSRLSLTGQVVLGIENTIGGDVSYNNPFTYDLSSGDNVEIIDGSVSVDNMEINEDNINLDINSNEISVTTEYFEFEEGYGEEYIGNGEELIIIDLASLDLIFSEGDLKVSLKYDEEEIVVLNTILMAEGNIMAEGEEFIDEIEDMEESIEENLPILETLTSIPSREGMLLEGLPRFLTEEEKEILFNEFGQSQIGIEKFNLGEGNIMVRFELEDYMVESVYDPSLSKEELAVQMDVDKTNWLKEVVSDVSNYERSVVEEQELEDLTEIYVNN
jgi:hypothetical protein